MKVNLRLLGRFLKEQFELERRMTARGIELAAYEVNNLDIVLDVLGVSEQTFRDRAWERWSEIVHEGGSVSDVEFFLEWVLTRHELVLQAN